MFIMIIVLFLWVWVEDRIIRLCDLSCFLSHFCVTLSYYIYLYFHFFCILEIILFVMYELSYFASHCCHIPTLYNLCTLYCVRFVFHNCFIIFDNICIMFYRVRQYIFSTFDNDFIIFVICLLHLTVFVLCSTVFDI